MSRLQERLTQIGKKRNDPIKDILQEQYEAKLKTLTLDINEQEESPIKGIEDEEKQYYREIIKEKISKLGENEELKRAFGEKWPQALKIIRQALKRGKISMDIEAILEDRTLLSLILAFDKERGLEKFAIDKKDYTGNLYEDVFGWQNQIPVKSIMELRKIAEEEQTPKRKEAWFMQLYGLYEQNNPEENKDPSTLILPEGIAILKKAKQSFRRSYDSRMPKIKNYKKIICPTTLQQIGEGFFYGAKMEEIELNNGLKTIGARAFKDCTNLKSLGLPKGLGTIPEELCEGCSSLEEITIPSTVREIRAKAFYSCEGLERITFSE